MDRRKLVWLIGIVILALAVALFLVKTCYMQRGYWAVGGEIFVPIAIVVWGVYSLFEGGKR